jgi:hypothetical protein
MEEHVVLSLVKVHGFLLLPLLHHWFKLHPSLCCSSQHKHKHNRIPLDHLGMSSSLSMLATYLELQRTLLAAPLHSTSTWRDASLLLTQTTSQVVL